MEQRIITARDDYAEFDQWLRENRCGKLLIVCGGSIRYMDGFNKHLEAVRKSGVKLVYFQDFQPNPLYESVVKGVELFRSERCDSIMAVGGGSAMDVAKCVKLYADIPGSGADGKWLKAETIPNNIPFAAMPTTAGSGSEATRYAVIYYEGAKQSITSESCIPGTILMDPHALKTLPLYQRKATMMDALCHAIESFWSVNSTEESKSCSKTAIKGVLRHMEGYLANTGEGSAGMLRAAHAAGKAINITQTTAGHAMSYKITSLFRSAHGHSAILCDRVLFPWMIGNTDKCIDPRGEEYLIRTLNEIGEAMGSRGAEDAAVKLNDIFHSLGLEVPAATEEQFELLRNSVDPVRLKNHPIALDVDTIGFLYHQILNGEAK